MESHCLPILSFATTAYDLNQTQLDDLNAAWNSIYRRIFGFNKWESVKTFINGLGRLDFKHLRAYLRVKFIKFGLLSKNDIFNHIAKRYVMSLELNLQYEALGLTNLSVENLLYTHVNALKNFVLQLQTVVMHSR